MYTVTHIYMASRRSLCLLLVFFTGLMGWSQAYFDLNIGGGKGIWTVIKPPKETYGHWAERMRFQIGDTVTFRYTKGLDSVLVVSKKDYHNCNTQKPDRTLTMENGVSKFKFYRSGPFYFITGNKANCQKGQKVIIIVLSPRKKTQSPAKSPAPATEQINFAPGPAPGPCGSAPPFTPPLAFMSWVTLVLTLPVGYFVAAPHPDFP